MRDNSRYHMGRKYGDTLKISYSKTAAKSIRALDRRMKERVKAGIERIPEGDICKIQNHSFLYRLRVGDYRVLFEMVGDEIYVDDVLPRGEAYKRFG